MKKQITLSLFLAFFFLAPTFAALAQKTASSTTKSTKQDGDWESIGTLRAARMGGDHDVMEMPEPYVNYDKLKLKVTGAPLTIKKMVINYDDGKAQTITNRYEIKKGSESNVIDLETASQKIQSVELWYDTKGLLKGKANVTVMGMK
jgi:hypothetical protein